MVKAVRVAFRTKGRSQAGCCQGALPNSTSTLPATRLFRFIECQTVRDAGRRGLHPPVAVTFRTEYELAPVGCR